LGGADCVLKLRTVSCIGSSSGTSHSQQSLQRPHLSQMWLEQVSFVHHTQMRVDSSPQIVH
jgi:hypothetical protein